MNRSIIKLIPSMPLLAALLSLDIANAANPVAWFKLNEGSGNSVSSAVGGYTGSGTSLGWATTGLAPVPLIPPANNTRGTTAASSLNGTLASAITTTYNGISGTAARTVAAWINAGQAQNNNPTIVGWGPNATGNRFDLRLAGADGTTAGGNLRMEVTGGGSFQTTGQTALTNGAWHHVAVTYNGSSGVANNTTLYIDGVAIQSGTLTLDTTAGYGVKIGGSYADTNTNIRVLTGNIDDVRIYSSALALADIQQLAFAPAITNSMANQLTTNSATFNSGITAFGTGLTGLTYQWSVNGIDVTGATGSTFNITTNDGTYTIAARGSNVYGSATNVATLTVAASPTYSQFILNDVPVAWWRLNEPAGTNTATDLIGARPASSTYGDLNNDITWAQEGALLGDSDTSAAFTGYNLNGRANRAKLDATYYAALNPSVFSVECWAMLNRVVSDYVSPLTSRDAVNNRGYIFYVNPSGSFEFRVGTGTGSSVLSGPAASLNEWAHLVGTYDGTTARFYVNGVLVSSSASGFSPNTTYGLRIGAGATEGPGAYFWPGRVDEVAVYSTALSTTQVQAHYAAAFPSTATPRFTRQPRARAIIGGESTTFNVKAHSALPVTYQWQHAGTNLPNATNATLTISSVAAADAGSYQVIATHGASNAISSQVGLAVLPGQAVSVSLMGFENARTIAANGGVAGYVAVTNWNEVGYNASSGSASGLVNHKGQPTSITVDWQASNNRRWNGLYSSAGGDFALLNGMIDGGSSNITVTVSNIPPIFQSAGYSVYVYLGTPNATAGIVNTNDWFGAVSAGGNTNYYHGIDLATWGGNWQLATTTNPGDSSPANANYAVFSGLTTPTTQITLNLHPLALTGPVSLSGLQIVADATNHAPTASAFAMGVAAGGSTTVNVVAKYTADADGDSVTISGVTQGASGTVTFAGGSLTYSNTVSASSDSFQYMVSDGFGGNATNTVTVSIVSAEGFNLLSTGDGGVMNYLGIPGQNYALEYTSSLTPPIAWTPVITNTAATNGSLTFTNIGAGFYRTHHVP